MACVHCQNITVCAICGKGYAEAMRANATQHPDALLEAVDSLLQTAPCDCSHARRYERGEHLSHCYLFDLNIARGSMGRKDAANPCWGNIGDER